MKLSIYLKHDDEYQGGETDGHLEKIWVEAPDGVARVEGEPGGQGGVVGRHVADHVGRDVRGQDQCELPHQVRRVHAPWYEGEWQRSTMPRW